MILRLVLSLYFLCIATCNSWTRIENVDNSKESIASEYKTLPQINCTSAENKTSHDNNCRNEEIAVLDINDSNNSSKENVEVARTTPEVEQVTIKEPIQLRESISEENNRLPQIDSSRAESVSETTFGTDTTVLGIDDNIKGSEEDKVVSRTSPNEQVYIQDDEQIPIYYERPIHIVDNKYNNYKVPHELHKTFVTNRDDCYSKIQVKKSIKNILEYVKDQPNAINYLLNEVNNDIIEESQVFSVQDDRKTDVRLLFKHLPQFENVKENVQTKRQCPTDLVIFINKYFKILSQLLEYPQCLQLILGCNSGLLDQVNYEQTISSNIYVKKPSVTESIFDIIEVEEKPNTEPQYIPPQISPAGTPELPEHILPPKTLLPDSKPNPVYQIIESQKPKLPRPVQITPEDYIQFINKFKPSYNEGTDIHYIVNNEPKHNEIPKPIVHTEPIYINEPEKIFVNTPIFVKEPETAYIEEPEPNFIENLKLSPKYISPEYPEPIYIDEPNTTVSEQPEPIYVEKSNSIEEPEKIYIKDPKPINIEEPKLILPEKHIYLERPQPIIIEKPEHVFPEQPEPIHIEHPKAISTESPENIYIENLRPIYIEQSKPNIITTIKQPEPKYVENPQLFYVDEPEAIINERPKPIYIKDSDIVATEEPKHMYDDKILKPIYINEPHKKESLAVTIEKPISIYVEEPSPIYVENSKPVYIDEPSPIYFDNSKIVYIDEPDTIQEPNPDYAKIPFIKEEHLPNQITVATTESSKNSDGIQPIFVKEPTPIYKPNIECPIYMTESETGSVEKPCPIYVKISEPIYIEELKPSPVTKPNYIEQATYDEPDTFYVSKPESYYVPDPQHYIKETYPISPTPEIIEQSLVPTTKGELLIIGKEINKLINTNPKHHIGEIVQILEQNRAVFKPTLYKILLSLLNALNEDKVDSQRFKVIFYYLLQPQMENKWNNGKKQVIEDLLLPDKTGQVRISIMDVILGLINQPEQDSNNLEIFEFILPLLKLIKKERVDHRVINVVVALLNRTTDNVLTPLQIHRLWTLIRPDTGKGISQKRIEIALVLVNLDEIQYLSPSSIHTIFSLIKPDNQGKIDTRAIEIVHEVLLPKQMNNVTKNDRNDVLSLLRDGPDENIEHKRLDIALFILNNKIYAPKLIYILLKVLQEYDLVHSKYVDIILYLYKHRLLDYALLEALTALLKQEATGYIDKHTINDLRSLLDPYKYTHPKIFNDVYNILSPQYYDTQNLNLPDVPENLKVLLSHLLSSDNESILVPDTNPLHTHIPQKNSLRQNRRIRKRNLVAKILQILQWQHNNELQHKSHDYGYIELTYMLKLEKPVLYHPVYYVKYKIPMLHFVKNVEDLLAENPNLTTNPEKLLHELIIDGKVSEISPNLKGYRMEDIIRLTFNDGNLIQAKALDEESIKLNDEIKFIQNLNSDVTPQEVLQQNNINAATYYFNLPPNLAIKENDGSSSNVQHLGNSFQNNDLRTIESQIQPEGEDSKPSRFRKTLHLKPLPL